jgi:hypothetical protein
MIYDLNNMRSVFSFPIEYGYKDCSRSRFGCRIDKQGMERERESNDSEIKM